MEMNIVSTVNIYRIHLKAVYHVNNYNETHFYFYTINLYYLLTELNFIQWNIHKILTVAIMNNEFSLLWLVHPFEISLLLNITRKKKETSEIQRVTKGTIE